jgi:hypothetical protein
VRLAVTAFLLGTAAVAALALGAAFVVIVVADASGREALRIGIGGVELLSFERRGARSETGFGPALVLLPLLGGILNAVSATVLRARAGGPR